MKVFLIHDKLTDIILAVSGSYPDAELQADRFFLSQKIRTYIVVQYV